MTVPAEAPRRRLVLATVVDVFVPAVVADILRIVDRAVLRTEQVERRPRNDAAAVRLLLCRVWKEAGADEHRVRTIEPRHFADRGIRPRVADSLLHRRCRRLQIAPRLIGIRRVVPDGQRGIKVHVLRKCPVHRDAGWQRKVIQHVVQIVVCRHDDGGHARHRDVERLIEGTAVAFANHQVRAPCAVDLHVGDLRRAVNEILEVGHALAQLQRLELRQKRRRDEAPDFDAEARVDAFEDAVVGAHPDHAAAILVERRKRRIVVVGRRIE